MNLDESRATSIGLVTCLTCRIAGLKVHITQGLCELETLQSVMWPRDFHSIMIGWVEGDVMSMPMIQVMVQLAIWLGQAAGTSSARSGLSKGTGKSGIDTTKLQATVLGSLAMYS